MKTKFRFPFYTLITETAEIMNLPPALAQTGPIRNDEKNHRAQQAFISDENQLTIYKILTESIQNNGKSYKEIMNDITTFILMLMVYLRTVRFL
jgi:hypothetical protein